MAFTPHTAQLVLLVQMLLPLSAACALLSLGNFRGREKICQILQFCLLAGSLCLTWHTGTSLFREIGAGPLLVRIPLPGNWIGPGILNQLVWRMDLFNAGILPFLFLTALTVPAFAPALADPHERGTGPRTLLLVGSLQLFLAGDDLGSCLSGGLLAAMLLVPILGQAGGEERRTAARQFLTTQWVGLMLLAAGIMMAAAAISLASAAPRGLPHNVALNLTDLTQGLQSAAIQHSATGILWKELRGVPTLLIVISFLILSAGFPFHVWLGPTFLNSPLSGRLWVALGVKLALLVGLRWLGELEPEVFPTLRHWGWICVLPGLLFAASQLLGHADFGRILAAAVFWSQQLILLGICAGNGSMNTALIPLILAQQAGLVLLIISLSTLSARYQSFELASFQGLAERATWLRPALLCSIFTLTLTPLPSGLLQAWVLFTSLQNETGWTALLGWGACVAANLMALAGLIRIVHRLVTGPVREPVIPVPLRDRVAVPVQEISLTLNSWQTGLLVLWGTVALGAGTLLTLVLRAGAAQGTP